MTTVYCSRVVSTTKFPTISIRPSRDLVRARPEHSGGRIGLLFSRHERLACTRVQVKACSQQSQHSSLPSLAARIDQGLHEVCVQNRGRPAAAGLTEVVQAAVQAFWAGYSLDRLQLELEYGGSRGQLQQSSTCRLTASEQRYCAQWLQTVYFTLQMLAAIDASDKAQRAARQQADAGSEEDQWLHAIVERVLLGAVTGDEQSAVQFDRALATSGASGGVAAGKTVIAPQLIPVSQIVLLTIKVQRELAASAF